MVQGMEKNEGEDCRDREGDRKGFWEGGDGGHREDEALDLELEHQAYLDSGLEEHVTREDKVQHNENTA
ncbi:hypothetical protein ACH5RR_040876 [Cinchona calisaya]|uniref:Uncharacterized protein n=1 Tax=Cinchona calisaya TaxID=153742 RepID=A0ABD2XV67_9GENT